MEMRLVDGPASMLDELADLRGTPHGDIWDRKNGTYFWRDGTELTLRQFAAAYEGGHYIAYHVVRNAARISTVWLGIDHSFGRSRKQIFETMVFLDRRVPRQVRRVWDERQWRYSTEVEALAGHDQIVLQVRQAWPSKVARRAERRRLQRTLRAQRRRL